MVEAKDLVSDELTDEELGAAVDHLVALPVEDGRRQFIDLVAKMVRA